MRLLHNKSVSNQKIKSKLNNELFKIAKLSKINKNKLFYL